MFKERFIVLDILIIRNHRGAKLQSKARSNPAHQLKINGENRWRNAVRFGTRSISLGAEQF